jgi:hypothetical protein
MDSVSWRLDPSIRTTYPTAYEIRITVLQGSMPVNPWGGQGDVLFNSARPYQNGELIAAGIVDNQVGIWKYTIDVLNNVGAVLVTNDPYFEVTKVVGGTVIPIDRLGLLAPYIGLASTIAVAAVATTVYVRRRKEKQ